MNQEFYTKEEVMQAIQDRCAASSQAAVAQEVGISQSHLNRLLGGHFGLTAEMAAKFGFVEQERKFVKVEVSHEQN